jgi:glycerol-3-phosphate O-acyltransferase
MILLSINGCCLRISADNPENMLADQVFQEKVIVAARPVIECGPFRNSILETIDTSGDVDPKQATVNRLMEMLEEQHLKYEAVRAAE